MMYVAKRDVLRAAVGAALSATGRARAAADAPVLRPEAFGARGDGRTNDTGAFRALAAEIGRRGGGTIELRRTTYLVGQQSPSPRPNGPWGYAPIDVMGFERLNAPLVIRGNGARLRCAAGLRYGTFDPANGRATRRAMPNYAQGELATPYRAMIFARGCTELVEIADLELDGNMAALQIGGPYGDLGHQIPALGIFLQDNLGPEVIRNVHSHHHAQDGVMIDGNAARRQRSRFERVVMEYNARQGLSMIGGRGYDFFDCHFSHTGRATLSTAPGAGIDLEAEGGKRNRDFTFTRCTFANNAGVGMLVAPGDSEQARFEHCTFIGTTAWGAWPAMPYMRFDRCRFFGAIVNSHGDPDPLRATRFADCTFSDDARASTTGKLYLPEGDHGAIVDAAHGKNVTFERCTFDLKAGGLLPWSVGVIYRDCAMRQRSPRIAYPRGSYVGRNTIAGAVDLYGSVIGGTLQLNGKTIPASR